MTVSEKIIQVLDNELLSTRYRYLTPMEALKALKFYGLIQSMDQLEELLESGEIPNAYKEDSCWRIPLSSCKATYTDVYSEYYQQNEYADNGRCNAVIDSDVKQRKIGVIAIGITALLVFSIVLWNNRPMVYNSWRDGSVYQVKEYIEKRAFDPDSYRPSEWDKVKKTSHGDYTVRHTYRLKTGLGVYNF